MAGGGGQWSGRKVWGNGNKYKEREIGGNNLKTIGETGIGQPWKVAIHRGPLCLPDWKE